MFLHLVNVIGSTSSVGPRRVARTQARSRLALGQAAGGSEVRRPPVGKVYQRCRPAPVVRVNLCVADNPNAALMATWAGQNASGLAAFTPVYNRHNRYRFTSTESRPPAGDTRLATTAQEAEADQEPARHEQVEQGEPGQQLSERGRAGMHSRRRGRTETRLLHNERSTPTYAASRGRTPRRRATAQSMAAKQRDI